MGLKLKKTANRKYVLLTRFWNIVSLTLTAALSSAPTKKTNQPLVRSLQQCFTPQDVLKSVGSQLNDEVDPFGAVSSLVLIRLCKQFIALDNCGETTALDWIASVSQTKNLKTVVDTLAIADWNSPKSLDAAVEGLKAASVISRIVPSLHDEWNPLLETWDRRVDLAKQLEAHQLSGLRWSYDCFQLNSRFPLCLPSNVEEAYEKLELPFRIIPGCFDEELDSLSVRNLKEEVQFRSEQIRAASGRVVEERRQTAWQGDEHVAPFAYSGKAMERRQWSPVVQRVREKLHQKTGHDYDCCLLNLYPDGGSGMRYHSDPDQGTLWGYETAVVSVGASRRFAFREVPENANSPQQTPHTFVVRDGDVTEMVADCQARFQHTVKTAEDKHEEAPRASLVFKTTMVQV
jgi:alkylated DNA repair dioxygenase AlkB